MAERKRLGELLVMAGLISESQLRAALAEQRRWGGPLGRILIDMQAINEEAMVQALSHQLNLPAINLERCTIATEVLDLLPGELAEELSAVPFAVEGAYVDVAMADPTSDRVNEVLRTQTRMTVRPYLAGPRAIERALLRHYGRGMKRLEISLADIPLRLNIDKEPADAPAVASTAPMVHELDGVRAREAELRRRIEKLEALVARDEDVLRKLLALIVEKGIATRDELRARMK